MRLDAAHFLAQVVKNNETVPIKKQLEVHGMPISIEHPRGSVRELKDKDGKTVYKKRMFHDYGFFNDTKGRDKDPVDVMVGPMPEASEAYIIHMKDMGPNKDEREDEDKVMIGFPNAEMARHAFLLHYPQNFYESMTVMPIEQFKEKMKQASLPYRHKKIHAKYIGDVVDQGSGSFMSKANADALVKHFKKLNAEAKCPKCGSHKYSLMPTDFETKKCQDCGKVYLR